MAKETITIDDNDGELIHVIIPDDDDQIFLRYEPDNDIDPVQEIPVWKERIPELIRALERGIEHG